MTSEIYLIGKKISSSETTELKLLCVSEDDIFSDAVRTGINRMNREYRVMTRERHLPYCFFPADGGIFYAQGIKFLRWRRPVWKAGDEKPSPARLQGFAGN
jgi:hypothetical protein